jgi:L-lactate dehydrogenase
MAVAEASRRCERFGVSCGVVGRAQHVACLAAFCLPALERHQLIVMMVGSPAERVVAPPRGRTPVLSTNPIAAAFPGMGKPVLFDVSTSMISLGELSSARDQRRRAKHPGILSREGFATDDTEAFRDLERTPLLPAGGLDHGYKGFALGLLVEALAHGLSGLGRVGHEPRGEENAVFILVIDPEAFGGAERFEIEIEALVEATRRSEPLDPEVPARAPGDRALALRQEQLKIGILLDAEVVARLAAWGERLNVTVPWAI